jgi:drug/metabolite transporter (DMT)-like permease
VANDKRLFGVYLALGGAMLAWGLSFLATKEIVSDVPVLSLLFVRFSVASLLLGAILWARRGFRLPRRDFAIVAALSLLSPVGYFLFETFGVANTQPSHVSVIVAAIPTAVFLIACFKRQERPTVKKGIGLVIAYGGIFALVVSGLHAPGASLLGDCLVLGAVACAAVRTVLIKDVLRRVTPLQVTFYQFSVSLLLFGPLAASDGWSWIGRVTATQLMEMLFLGIVCSAGAFLALHYALSHLSATRVAASTNFIPVITLLAEVLLLGTGVSVLKGLGTTAVIGGVLLTQLGERSVAPVAAERG